MIYERKYIDHPVTRPRIPLTVVKKIVCHWTANRAKGAGADAHFNYFNNGAPYKDKDGAIKSRPASAHYVVDDRKVIQLLPENEIAYHVGDRNFGNKYAPLGKSLIEPGKPTPNFSTIGYEICVNADADFWVTEVNSYALAGWLLFRHGLGIDDLVRHMDLTGKKCPQMYLETAKWQAYKDRVLEMWGHYHRMYERRIVTASALNVRTGPGTEYPIKYTLQQGEIVAVTAGSVWQQIEPVDTLTAGGFINTKFTKTI